MESQTATIYVVDDDESIARTSETLLTRAGYIVRTYSDGSTFLKDADRHIPGCVLLDLNLPGIDGLAIQSQMVEEGWPLPVVFMTGYATVDKAVRAMRDGATTFLSKPASPDKLIAAVQEAVEADALRRRLEVERIKVGLLLEKLTPRELEVVNLIVQGLRTREIAEHLFISIKTVETHRDNIMKKLEAGNVAEVVRIVTTHNMFSRTDA